MFWLSQFTLSWTKNNMPGSCQMTPDDFRMRTKRSQKWWMNLRCGRTWGVGGYVRTLGKMNNSFLIETTNMIVPKLYLKKFNVFYVIRNLRWRPLQDLVLTID